MVNTLVYAPQERTPQLRAYVHNRGIEGALFFHDVDEFAAKLIQSAANVIIVDEWQDTAVADVLAMHRYYVNELLVFSGNTEIGRLYLNYTTNIFVLPDNRYALDQFWDNEVFSLENCVICEDSKYPVVILQNKTSLPMRVRSMSMNYEVKSTRVTFNNCGRPELKEVKQLVIKINTTGEIIQPHTLIVHQNRGMSQVSVPEYLLGDSNISGLIDAAPTSPVVAEGRDRFSDGSYSGGQISGKSRIVPVMPVESEKKQPQVIVPESDVIVTKVAKPVSTEMVLEQEPKRPEIKPIHVRQKLSQSADVAADGLTVKAVEATIPPVKKIVAPTVEKVVIPEIVTKPCEEVPVIKDNPVKPSHSFMKLGEKLRKSGSTQEPSAFNRKINTFADKVPDGEASLQQHIWQPAVQAVDESEPVQVSDKVNAAESITVPKEQKQESVQVAAPKPATVAEPMTESTVESVEEPADELAAVTKAPVVKVEAPEVEVPEIEVTKTDEHSVEVDEPAVEVDEPTVEEPVTEVAIIDEPTAEAVTPAASEVEELVAEEQLITPKLSVRDRLKGRFGFKIGKHSPATTQDNKSTKAVEVAETKVVAFEPAEAEDNSTATDSEAAMQRAEIFRNLAEKMPTRQLGKADSEESSGESSRRVAPRRLILQNVSTPQAFMSLNTMLTSQQLDSVSAEMSNRRHSGISMADEYLLPLIANEKGYLADEDYLLYLTRYLHTSSLMTWQAFNAYSPVFELLPPGKCKEFNLIQIEDGQHPLSIVAGVNPNSAINRLKAKYGANLFVYRTLDKYIQSKI